MVRSAETPARLQKGGREKAASETQWVGTGRCSPELRSSYLLLNGILEPTALTAAAARAGLMPAISEVPCKDRRVTGKAGCWVGARARRTLPRNSRLNAPLT